jgi:hypothetical protein
MTKLPYISIPFLIIANVITGISNGWHWASVGVIGFMLGVLVTFAIHDLFNK